MQPSIGRFVTEDEIRFKAGVNFYSYVLNNSVNNIDPYGRETFGVGTYCSGTFFGGTANQNTVIVIDSQWNIAVVESGAGGGATSAGAVSAGFLFQYTEGNVCDLAGPSAQVGLSGGEVFDIGGEVSIGETMGACLTLGAGGEGPLPIELHGTGGGSVVVDPFNVKKFIQYVKKWLEHPFPIFPNQDWSSCNCEPKK
jgi:hypothetical protein